ncbi:archease [Candidatus Peregrinibacteria bacterium]|nr:archease [Candidatus Peregrinibacteria bacterium]
MPFTELPHTGDIRYRVTGATREELFADAAKALFSTITDLDKVEAKDERRIEAFGQVDEELFINFLRKALDLFNDDGFVARDCRITFLGIDGSDWLCSIQATLTGERFDRKKHPYRTEIKAVTYHGAELKQTQEGWKATFTLDL